MRRDLLPPVADVRAMVALALVEDLTPLGDLTSSLIDPDLMATAEFNAREPGVIAGCLCVEETFAAVDASLTIEWSKTDGDRVAIGDVLGVARGPFATLLTAERTALNFLSALSGIATNAARWVDLAAGRVIVWDTRKTTPGYRSMQKAAVRAGGAANHRGNLSDWLMLKDNHLIGTTITDAVVEAKRRWPGRTIHVEADRREQMLEAMEAGADIILLDNFSPHDLTQLVTDADAWAGEHKVRRPLLEASGGISYETLDDYANTGVDLVSSGSLTNSAGVLDIGLDVRPIA
ncbi:MAG: carboxylating nicotinate-nucleotide diphosphorylase [Acidimicrobiales bacterium]|nr:carboxylating nicotinate-nucleotide diphosphorylase [Acidimicrobiales bacterium]